jgi:DNA-binding response OmpR family regulator
MMAKILVVEDEPEIVRNLENLLKIEHYTVETTDNGQDGLYMLETFLYDAAIIDWHLPKLSGVDLCRQYRATGGATPILMLTGKATIHDKKTGLDGGADDYLTKPFHVDEFMARVRALLRRSGRGAPTDKLVVGPLALDAVTHEVALGDTPLKLLPKEFAILELLMRSPGKVFAAEEIVTRVWKSDESGSAEAVRTHIKNLRKKLSAQAAGEKLETVHGVGYKLLP